jgi:uncharacterized protein (DUF849 family)
MSLAARPILVQCPLNGGRTHNEHPAVPTTASELAAAAADAAAAGARSFHVHPRDADGAESLRPADVTACVRAVRVACPGIPVGTTTNVWGVEHGPERLELVSSWDHATLPDFCSVNLEEVDAIALMELLLDRNVGIEAGLWQRQDAERLLASGLAERCLRILVEPITEDPAEALARVVEVEEALGDLPVPQLHHGDGAATWAVIARAIPDGRDIRIGLEDALTLPDGRVARDNAELVAAAIDLFDEPAAGPG